MEVPSELSKIWSDGSPAIAVEAMHRSRHCPHRTESWGEKCASGGRLASVAVMESTHQGQGDNVPLLGRFNRTRFGRILVQRAMGAMLMIISEIVGEPVLPKNLAALEKLWFTRLPDSSSSAFRRVLFGIGCDPPPAETSAARSLCSRSIDDCAAGDNS